VVGMPGPRERAVAGSMAAATIAAAAAWSGTTSAATFTVVGSNGLPQGRTAPRRASSIAPQGKSDQTMPSHGEAAAAAWPQLAAVAGAIVGAVKAAGRRRAAPPGAHAHSGRAGALAVGQQAMHAHLSAVRGDAEATATGRGARIVVKNGGKTKRGPYARWRRKEMWLNLSKNFKGKQRNLHRLARQTVMDSMKKKYKSRRLFKRERRKLWIMRCNANCKLHGQTYSWFISKAKEANININRKILAQLGIYDRGIFTNIMDLAIPNWKAVKARREYVNPGYSVEQRDDIMIPYIEKCVPEIYTDANIRFNRKVLDGGMIRYTVDMGTPEDWREVLPKMPELANFNLPDHWMRNPNAEDEPFTLDMVTVPEGDESKDYRRFQYRVAQEKARDKKRAEAGEPTWPTKEGVSRKDWFADEPQSWY